MFRYTTKKQERILTIVFVISLLLPIAMIRLTLDNDLWFMLNHGRYIVAHGFVNTEPFTIHKDLTFSFEKWLTCVVFWEIYHHFGYWGMYFFVVGIGVVILLLALKLAMIVTENNFRISTVVILLTCIPLYSSFIVTRPQIFSYIALLLTLICLEKYARDADWKKTLLFLPIISIVLMQFHSTMWIGMFVIMLPYMCDFGFIRFGRVTPGMYRKFPIWIAAWASFLAGFINPYGFRSIKYTVVSLMDNSISSAIAELQKTTVTQWQIYVTVAIVYLVYLLMGTKEVKLRYLFMGLGTFFMGMFAIRNISFLLIGATPVIADMLKNIHISWKNLKLAAFGLFLIPIYTALVFVQDGMDVSEASKTKTDCSTAVDWLSDYVKKEGSKPSKTRLFTAFNDGAYGEYKGFKCYIDPRAEVFIYPINEKGNIFAEAFQFEYGQLTYYDMQCAYDFDYMLVSNSAMYYKYMRWDSNAKVIYTDDNYTIFDMREYPITESDDNYKGIVAITEEQMKENQTTKEDNTPDIETTDVTSDSGIKEIQLDNKTVRVNTDKNAFDYSKVGDSIDVQYIDELEAYYYYDENEDMYYYYGTVEDMQKQGYIDSDGNASDGNVDNTQVRPSSINVHGSEDINNMEVNNTSGK